MANQPVNQRQRQRTSRVTYGIWKIYNGKTSTCVSEVSGAKSAAASRCGCGAEWAAAASAASSRRAPRRPQTRARPLRSDSSAAAAATRSAGPCAPPSGARRSPAATANCTRSPPPDTARLPPPSLHYSHEQNDSILEFISYDLYIRRLHTV